MESRKKEKTWRLAPIWRPEDNSWSHLLLRMIDHIDAFNDVLGDSSRQIFLHRTKPCFISYQPWLHPHMQSANPGLANHMKANVWRLHGDQAAFGEKPWANAINTIVHRGKIQLGSRESEVLNARNFKFSSLLMHHRIQGSAWVHPGILNQVTLQSTLQSGIPSYLDAVVADQLDSKSLPKRRSTSFNRQMGKLKKQN